LRNFSIWTDPFCRKDEIWKWMMFGAMRLLVLHSVQRKGNINSDSN
jgi:hypothetical protein